MLICSALISNSKLISCNIVKKFSNNKSYPYVKTSQTVFATLKGLKDAMCKFTIALNINKEPFIDSDEECDLESINSCLFVYNSIPKGYIKMNKKVLEYIKIYKSETHNYLTRKENITIESVSESDILNIKYFIMINTQYNISKNIMIDMSFLVDKLISYNKNNDTICVTNLYKYTLEDTNKIKIISDDIEYFSDININDYVCFIINRIISSSSITLNVVLTQNLHSYRFYTIQKLITIFNTNIKILGYPIKSIDNINSNLIEGLYVLDNLKKEKQNGYKNDNFYTKIYNIINNINNIDESDNFRIYPIKMLFENIYLFDEINSKISYYRTKYSEWRSNPTGSMLCPQYWSIDEVLNEIINIKNIIIEFVNILNIINYTNKSNPIIFNCLRKYILKKDGVIYYNIYDIVYPEDKTPKKKKEPVLTKTASKEVLSNIVITEQNDKKILNYKKIIKKK